jgi:hypothetical protein
LSMGAVSCQDNYQSTRDRQERAHRSPAKTRLRRMKLSD